MSPECRSDTRWNLQPLGSFLASHRNGKGSKYLGWGRGRAPGQGTSREHCCGIGGGETLLLRGICVCLRIPSKIVARALAGRWESCVNWATPADDILSPPGTSFKPLTLTMSVCWDTFSHNQVWSLVRVPSKMGADKNERFPHTYIFQRLRPRGDRSNGIRCRISAEPRIHPCTAGQGQQLSGLLRNCMFSE